MQWTTKTSGMMDWYGFKTTDEDLVINQFAYGLGIMLSSYDSWNYVQHGGDFPPYHSQLSFYPTQKLGIFSSINMGMGQYPIDRLALHAFIFETLKGNPNAAEKAERLSHQLSKLKHNKRIQDEENFQEFYQTQARKAKLHRQNEIVGVYGSGHAG